jgi:C_GCAxxG_C_C family probable redox protein
MNSQKAVECYQNGCNCAQAILAAFAEKTGMDNETALKIGAGFGGGMNIAGPCGAGTGAVMAIGAKFGTGDTDNMDAKRKVSQFTRQFIKEFEEKNSSLVCMELKRAHKKDCNNIVRDAGEILERML